MKVLQFKFLLFLLLACTLLYTGCNADAESASDVNQDRISTEYILEYRKHENKTYAWVVFRFGDLYQGTPLQLGNASSITCNGVPMTYGVIPLINLAAYKREFTGFVDSLTFVYKDSLNRTYTNTIDYPRTVEWPGSVTSVSKSGGVFQWLGEPLAQADSMYIWVDDDTLAFESNIFSFAFGVGDTAIVYPARAALETGNATAAWVTRTNRVPTLQAPAIGGVLRVEYKDYFTSRGGVVSIVP